MLTVAEGFSIFENLDRAGMGGTNTRGKGDKTELNNSNQLTLAHYLFRYRKISRMRRIFA